MKRVGETQFVSDFGFRSNNFTVDSEGNISANSINLVDSAPDPGVLSDFIISNDVSNNFLIQNIAGTNPSINFVKSRRYIFELNLTTTGISFYRQDQTTFYNTNLIHSSGDRGIDAQGKRTGTLSITIPSTYNESIIYYSNDAKSVFGTINILDPVGVFSNVEITGQINSTSPTTGSLIVDGGVGISEDLYIGGQLNIGGIGVSKLSSSTNLELNANNKIVLQIDNTNLGEINSQGLAIPINNSTINNTTIGASTPSSAVFTTASVSTSPITDSDVTNKSYVDLTSAAFAIALGS
jgi:hypothetical protein